MDKADEQTVPTWIKKQESKAPKRGYHASIVYNNYILTFGGFDGARYLNDLLAYEIRSQEWSVIKPLKNIPTSRSNHTMCLTPNNNILTYGGENFNGKVSNDIILMTLSQNAESLFVEWDIINSESEHCPYRTCHVAHTYQNKMYVFGGLNENNKDTNDIWCLSLETFMWNQCQTSGDIPGRYTQRTCFDCIVSCADHCSAMYKNKMYVFGGYSSQKENFLNDMYVLDIPTMKWQLIFTRGSAPIPRCGASAQEIKNKIYIFGGDKGDETYSNELFVYSIDNCTWDQVQTKGKSPSPRSNHASVCFKDNLFILGGSDELNYFSDVYSISMETKKSAKAVLVPDVGTTILKDLFLDKSFADVVFKVDNQEFPAHKVVLVQRCKYFSNIFTNGEADSKTFLSFPDIKANTFKAMLSFIYGHEVLILEEDLAFELFELSFKYLIPDLKKEAEEFLSGLLNLDNFVKIAKSAEAFEGHILNEAVLDFAIKHDQVLKDRDDLYDLSKAILVQMFKKAVSK